MLTIFSKLKIHFQSNKFTYGQIGLAEMMRNKKENLMVQSDLIIGFDVLNRKWILDFENMASIPSPNEK